MATPDGFGYVERDRFVARHDVAGAPVRSFAQDSAGNVWVADQRAGLISLATERQRRARFPGLRWDARTLRPLMIADPMRGGLWLGFWDGGIGHFEDGQRARSLLGAPTDWEQGASRVSVSLRMDRCGWARKEDSAGCGTAPSPRSLARMDCPAIRFTG